MYQLYDGITTYGPPGKSSMICPPGLNSSMKLKIPNNFGSLPLGLPEGVKSAEILSEVSPNPYIKGAPLPRPYGPRDNLRAHIGLSINGFGNKREKEKEKEKESERERDNYNNDPLVQKLKKIRSRSKKLLKVLKRKSKKKTKSRNKYGNSTPGTDAWLKSMNDQDLFDTKVADIIYIPEKPINSNMSLNVPMQYKDNKYNSPIINRSHFGQKATLDSFMGPNNVGHESGIKMYHAGSNTIDFMTGKYYEPHNLYKNALKVGPDNVTPDAYLNMAKGLNITANAVNANGLLKNGLKFGNNLIPSAESYGSNGPLYQPPPMYIKAKEINNSSGFVSYGKNSKTKKTKKNLLSTNIGRAKITLSSDGHVYVT